jgi:flagellar motility protein MotE (MotC chaperone)
MPYTHVSKFFLTEGIFFSSIEIVAPGELKESIKLKFVSKKGARIAKFIIDEKTKEFGGRAEPEDLEYIKKIEKYIKRLYQLKKERKISYKELNKRREIFLKKIEKNHRIG